MSEPAKKKAKAETGNRESPASVDFDRIAKETGKIEKKDKKKERKGKEKDSEPNSQSNRTASSLRRIGELPFWIPSSILKRSAHFRAPLRT